MCDGDACIIAGSDADLKNYLSQIEGKGGSSYTLKKTRFGEIMCGMSMGAAYAFDESAYNRFYRLAQREGVQLGPEDFPLRAEGKNFIRMSFEGAFAPD